MKHRIHELTFIDGTKKVGNHLSSFASNFLSMNHKKTNGM